jgi:hypothetical protein
MAKAALIRVLLADDHAMVRQGLRGALQAYPNIEVVGEAGSSRQSMVLLRSCCPLVSAVPLPPLPRRHRMRISPQPFPPRRQPQQETVPFSFDWAAVQSGN